MRPDSIRVLAPAKINLTLEVIGRRPDGYHDLTSVLQTVDLFDVVELSEAPAFRFVCSDPALAGPENLACHAVHALAERLGRAPAVSLSLEKRIPVAAGLGGGSSDAAAAIRGACALWGISYEPARFVDLAASLGSDVPFFLFGGVALVEGRGEHVAQLAAAPSATVLLLPGSHDVREKTAQVFARLSPSSWSRGVVTQELVTRWPVDLTGIPPEVLVNNLEAVAGDIFPDLRVRCGAMIRAGAPYARLSGAGPTLFAIFPSDTAAEVAAAKLRAGGLSPIVCRTLGSLPPPERMSVERSTL